jgi:N-acetylglucosaminyl-diphospho-decaprenol L-rhamnosyltransferase
MSITAIIVTYDSAHILPECLTALKAEDVARLVVDNASQDETVAVAKAHGADVLINDVNQGYGRANSQGVASARSEWVLVCNPDCVVQKGAVAALLKAATNYPEAGMLAPRIMEPDGRFFFHSRSFLGQSVVKTSLLIADKAMPLPSGDVCAPFLSGACFLMRRALFTEMGGFDPQIFLFFEDDDLCRRLRDQGLALVHVHEALVHHARGASSAPKPWRIYKSRWHQAWSRAYVAHKYGLANPAMSFFMINAVKTVLACLTLNRARMERYAGSVAGAFAFLRGKASS